MAHGRTSQTAPYMTNALKSLSSQLVRFGIVGVAATLTHAAIFVGAIEYLGILAVPAVMLAFSVALIVSHLGHHQWTFRSTTSHRESFPRFALVAIFGLGMNTLITWIVVDVLGMWYGIALILGILSVPPLTFLLSRKLVYNSATN